MEPGSEEYIALYGDDDDIELIARCKESFDKGFNYGYEKGNEQGLKDRQMYFRMLLLEDLTIKEIKKRLHQKDDKNDHIVD